MSEISKQKVLVIEDDLDIAKLVEGQLLDLGFEVEHIDNGEAGLGRALEGRFALIVLDLMLPGLGGIEICRRLRKQGSDIPIMMLTGKGDTVDKVLGLETGADEYMTKPFHVSEFSARVRTVLRRARGEAPSQEALPKVSTEPLKFRELLVDDVSRQVLANGVTLHLTRGEYDLLNLFVKNPGRVFSREQLLSHVWDTDPSLYSENITTHISRLRNKLASVPGCEKYIVTIRGVGYRLVKEDEDLSTL